jgi:hypothetical protein
MAIFIPRNANEILREMLGKLLNRTELSDISTSSTLYHIIQSVALEIANTETRLLNIRNGYSLENAIGADLDARVAELPPGQVFRKRSAYAGGAVLTITRNNSTGDLIIPAGSIVSNSNTNINYIIPEEQTIPSGSTSISNVFVICAQPGTSGNIDIGQINTIVDMPEDVVTVSNTAAITTGQNAETDSSLRTRALRFVKSLGKCQKSSLEFLGTSFISQQGQSARFARIWEDPTQLGYSELIVDDGAGFENQATTGPIISGTITANSQLYLYHEFPATEPLVSGVNFSIIRGGTEIVLGNTQYKSIPERGIIYVEEGVLQTGDTWSINNYQVYKGFMAELQNEIEGSTNTSVFTLPGYRAAGTRVRVQPPTKQDLTFTVKLTPIASVNVKNIRNTLKQVIVNYVNSLDIGEPLIITKLTQVCQNTGLLINISIEDNDGGAFPDVYPSSNKTVLRTTENQITII